MVNFSEPLAEPPRFGWVLMSIGKEAEFNEFLCSKTSVGDYDNLCKLDVFGVTDIAPDDILYFNISRINVAEARMVGIKLN